MTAFRRLSDIYAVAPQIAPQDVASVAAAGYRSIISNRPDGESVDQANFESVSAAASALGLETRHIAFKAQPSASDIKSFITAMDQLPKPVLAYCRSGQRSEAIWRQSGAARSRANLASTGYDVVIVGGGAAGISVAASLLKRAPDLTIAVIEPSAKHFYQPGWTMVGAGIFTAQETARATAEVMPDVSWIQEEATSFDPHRNQVAVKSGTVVTYKALVVCPGLRLDWDAVDGLANTLGSHGVTSNYRFDLAPYTWELVQAMTHGRAVFTQPPMPIKCAGAPQKALYLSADHWRRSGRLSSINIDFYNAGGVLFGVAAYVPALVKYMERYRASVHYNHNLIAVDGPSKTALFELSGSDGAKKQVETKFDLLHVCPPQNAHTFIKNSELADANGWVDVDQSTLRHKILAGVYGLGDAANTPNAKTAAAARKQAPVVAENVLADLGRGGRESVYDGYGSCPLTVERGKIVLAEFAYGGKVSRSFPAWLLDGTKPSRAAWFLKRSILPKLYWDGMLKGREVLAKPRAA